MGTNHVPEHGRFGCSKRVELLGVIIGVVSVITGIIVGILPEEYKQRIFNLSAPAADTITPTSPFAYEIGIAVAYFALPNDDAVTAQEADQLVEQIHTRLTSEMNSFAEQMDLTIGFIPPSTVGRIQGRTPAEREDHAHQIAKQYGIGMVFYGEITVDDGGQVEVQPEFYVSPEIFSQALEMTGAFRLGRAIEIEGTLASLRTAMSLNRVLSARTAALAHVFAGLIHYLLEDYSAALTAFEQANAQPGWEQTEGREVLYVLLGNTTLRLASVAAMNRDTTTASQQLEQAVGHYDKASQLAAQYSRPYVGLASAAYIRWNVQLQATGNSDKTLLDQASAYLDQAAQALDQPQEAAVQTRSLFNRLQLDFATWLYHKELFDPADYDALFTRFDAAAEQIIRRYEDRRDVSVQELASETHALRGLAAQNQGQCDQAVDRFQQAIDLSFSSHRRMFFYGWQADCYVLLNQPETAIRLYTQALELAQSINHIPAEQSQRYEQAIQNLRGRG